MNELKGKIVAIYGSVADVQFESEIMPAIYEIITASNYEGKDVILEVVEHLVVAEPIYWQDLRKAMQAPSASQTRPGRDEDVLWYGIDRTQRQTARSGRITAWRTIRNRPGDGFMGVSPTGP
jgi:hypothetical protein